MHVYFSAVIDSRPCRRTIGLSGSGHIAQASRLVRLPCIHSRLELEGALSLFGLEAYSECFILVSSKSMHNANFFSQYPGLKHNANLF